jgi:UDP-N-acetylglucosamine 2-epimerase (non-hydrolysing)
MPKITIIAGARPNFMKIAPIIAAINRHNNKAVNPIQFRLVHTGQHYNANLSDSFFKDLDIPEPDVNLEVGSGTHAVQTAAIMVKLEQELLKNPTDLVLVVGDVNSTMAATLVAKKMNVKVAHIEAGLRSYDMTMPEEINRLVTDVLADYFFTTTVEAGENLKKLSATIDRIYFVGNTMIDSLQANLGRLISPQVFMKNDIKDKDYFLLTLHRPSNVDDIDKLDDMLRFLADLANGKTIIFPVHPRTQSKLEGLPDLPKNIIFTDPLPYLEFIYLVKNALAVVTDSGGIQEETTYLKIPCLTLRENTERPETISIGSNLLLGFDKGKIKKAFENILSGNWKKSSIPDLWDGKAAERIVKVLAQKL